MEMPFFILAPPRYDREALARPVAASTPRTAPRSKLLQKERHYSGRKAGVNKDKEWPPRISQATQLVNLVLAAKVPLFHDAQQL